MGCWWSPIVFSSCVLHTGVTVILYDDKSESVVFEVTLDSARCQLDYLR